MNVKLEHYRNQGLPPRVPQDIAAGSTVNRVIKK
jgi:hypothetical protein